jgi:hypothetical protein
VPCAIAGLDGVGLPDQRLRVTVTRAIARDRSVVGRVDATPPSPPETA